MHRSNRLFASNGFWLIVTVTMIAFSSTLFLGWVLMVATLYSFFWAFRFTGMEAKLNDRERQVYRFTVLLYPIVETGVQWMVMRGMVPSDFTWVNRLEHSCWATALTMMMMPFVSGVWKRLDRVQNFIFIAAFVCFFGNLTEFLEFFTRTQHPPFNESLFTKFYIDTIYDMMMNLIGSIVSYIILTFIHRKGAIVPSSGDEIHG